MTVEEQFLNKAKFSKMVEKAVGDLKITYMDAILYICEKNDIEPEDVKKFVSLTARRQSYRLVVAG